MLSAIFLAALCHECGHLILIYALGGRVGGLAFSPCGLTLRVSGTVSYRKEIAIASAGPAVNGLLFLFFTLTHRAPLFAEANLALGLFNLCPVASLDGGRILYALLAPRLGPDRAFRRLRALSFLTLLLLWAVSVFFLIEADESLSLFFLSVWLFASLFVEKEKKEM